MFKIPEKSELKSISTYDSLTQLSILKDICNRIYIARNISLNNDTILSELERIDTLFREREPH